MQKIRFTKGELKYQRDALKQYERYLPTLQLKKQQLQMEIIHQLSMLGAKRSQEASRAAAAEAWLGLLADDQADIRKHIKIKKLAVDSKNIAGVDIPIFSNIEFENPEYDLFLAPLWVDVAIERLREIASIRQETLIINKGIEILRHELRITTQRVNLFEKVKIPDAKEAIRLIKIYIGDQMTNAVGRSKIAKRKIEEYVLEGVAA